MWILRINTVSQFYPKFTMKLNFWVKTGWGLEPPLNSSMTIHIRRLTKIFTVLYYLPIYSKDISETCHRTEKGVWRTNGNKLITEWQKDEKKNQNLKQNRHRRRKPIHEKSTTPSSVRRSPIQALTGLALLNFTEKTRTLCFHPI